MTAVPCEAVADANGALSWGDWWLEEITRGIMGMEQGRDFASAGQGIFSDIVRASQLVARAAGRQFNSLGENGFSGDLEMFPSRLKPPRIVAIKAISAR
ncbi:MAG: hypothetical protein V9H26_09040 [Verrucomicrobiota bacterium]